MAANEFISVSLSHYHGHFLQQVGINTEMHTWIICRVIELEAFSSRYMVLLIKSLPLLDVKVVRDRGRDQRHQTNKQTKNLKEER